MAHLDAARVDVDRLLSSIGLSRKDMDNPEVRIPRELVGDAWRAAVAVTGDEALGLRVASDIRWGTLGLIEYAARNGSTLGEALHTVCRYSELLAEGVHFKLEQSDQRARLSYVVTGSPQPPSVMDFALAYVARAIAEFTQPPVELLEVSFDHPAPADRAPYDAAFRTRGDTMLRARLRFDARQNAVVFYAHALHSRLQSADPQLQAVLEHQAARLASELPKSDDFEGRVKRLIAAELRAGDATSQGLAKKLHMSPRTFQRRLLAAGTTHSKLLDEVRHTLALRLLDQGQLRLGEIAAELGFSDVSAFRKAFKRWTGRALRRSEQAP